MGLYCLLLFYLRLTVGFKNGESRPGAYGPFLYQEKHWSPKHLFANYLLGRKLESRGVYPDTGGWQGHSDRVHTYT